MLRTTNPQHSLWEAILPDACLGLPAELARVDTLLDDPAFLAPLAAHFDPRLGRPGQQRLVQPVGHRLTHPAGQLDQRGRMGHPAAKGDAAEPLPGD